jgi:hypothetical protein
MGFIQKGGFPTRAGRFALSSRPGAVVSPSSVDQILPLGEYAVCGHAVDHIFVHNMTHDALQQKYCIAQYGQRRTFCRTLKRDHVCAYQIDLLHE